MRRSLATVHERRPLFSLPLLPCRTARFQTSPRPSSSFFLPLHLGRTRSFPFSYTLFSPSRSYFLAYTFSSTTASACCVFSRTVPFSLSLTSFPPPSIFPAFHFLCLSLSLSFFLPRVPVSFLSTKNRLGGSSGYRVDLPASPGRQLLVIPSVPRDRWELDGAYSLRKEKRYYCNPHRGGRRSLMLGKGVTCRPRLIILDVSDDLSRATPQLDVCACLSYERLVYIIGTRHFRCKCT